METQPYLFFEGRCDEAIAFYRKAVGAEVTMLMHYKDSPDPQHCAGIPPDKVMHASFKIGGTGPLSAIIKENCPLVSAAGRSASSKRRASARAARCTCRHRQVSRTMQVTAWVISRRVAIPPYC